MLQLDLDIIVYIHLNDEWSVQASSELLLDPYILTTHLKLKQSQCPQKRFLRHEFGSTIYTLPNLWALGNLVSPDKSRPVRDTHRCRYGYNLCNICLESFTYYYSISHCILPCHVNKCRQMFHWLYKKIYLQTLTNSRPFTNYHPLYWPSSNLEKWSSLTMSKEFQASFFIALIANPFVQ